LTKILASATVEDSRALRSTYEKRHGLAYEDSRIGIEEKIKTEPKSFFLSGSGSHEICDLFARFLERTYAGEPWGPSDPGPDDVGDEPPFGSLQFTVLEVLNALLDLDIIRVSDGIPPLILKGCASAFALSLCLLFNRSLCAV
jgi:hypothetical protein